MIFEFLKKQQNKKRKKDLIIIMIQSLQIPEPAKLLYLEALSILDFEGLDLLYNDLTNFIERFENKELEEISKENFSSIAWMRKKEALEKQKEINSFSFLLHNL